MNIQGIWSKQIHQRIVTIDEKAIKKIGFSFSIPAKGHHLETVIDYRHSAMSLMEDPNAYFKYSKSLFIYNFLKCCKNR